MARVHLVDYPLSEYLRFEIEAAYRYTEEAGERIYLLDRARCSLELQEKAGEDFWLFDDAVVMVQEYSESGRFLRARVSEDRETVARYQAIRREVLEMVGEGGDERNI
ncbi:MAG: hypothetical protein RL417_1914 [Pseudomonadota bacterium]|jgi:hypothetical protein